MSEIDSLTNKEFNVEKESKNLNEVFKNRTPAYEVLDKIRKYPKPIVLDFNNVLANNSTPLEVNPHARNLLDSLSDVGNVFIVTTARSWEAVHKFLEENKLWKKDIVLMTMPNWDFMTQSNEDSPKGKSLRKEYIEKVNNLGKSVDEKDLIAPSGLKRIAPLFNKSWEIPIIDDATYACIDNPGMHGILVKSFDPENNPRYEKQYQIQRTFEEAIEEVKEIYRTI